MEMGFVPLFYHHRKTLNNRPMDKQMKLKRIKLTDIVDEEITNKELNLLFGGNSTFYCPSSVCSSNLDFFANCTVGGVCKTGLV